MLMLKEKVLSKANFVKLQKRMCNKYRNNILFVRKMY